MQVKEVYLDGSRWYEVIQDSRKTPYPSVNTVLSATESPEAKQRLINWKFKQAQKFLAQNRACQNCLHLTGEKAIGMTSEKSIYTFKYGCAAGEKLRSPITKKHRCKSFALNAEMEAAKAVYNEKARNRGTAVHQHIENWFEHGIMPTPEICPYSSQISFLLKNLKNGKLFAEEWVWSQTHRYAGRVDFCGHYLDKIVVLDWVTTERNYLQPEHFERKFLQCAGYALAIAEMDIAQPTELIVVAMTPTQAELYRHRLETWADPWLKRVKQFWGQQSNDNH